MNGSSDIASGTEPVSDGQLSPDGRFQWEGGRWVYASRHEVKAQRPPAKQLRPWPVHYQPGGLKMVCSYHADNAAAGTCIFCGRALCAACLNSLTPTGSCFDCAFAAHATELRRIKRSLLIVGLLATVTGLILFAGTGRADMLLVGAVIPEAYYGFRLVGALTRRVRILATPFAWLIVLIVCLQIAAFTWPIQLFIDIRRLRQTSKKAYSVSRAAQLVGVVPARAT